MGTRAKDAVAAMIKRLAHRNANVQLYTLEVCLPVGIGRSKAVVADWHIACERPFTKLWRSDAQGVIIEKLHRGLVEIGG